MPGFDVKFISRQRGPFKSGQMSRDVADYEHDVAEAIAEEGKRIVLVRLGSVLRHPSGYYESQIDTKELASNRYEVHDSGVIYGPWLEGTGSRNSPVTRFPGYWTFKQSKEILDAKRRNIARKILKDYRSRGKLR